MFFQVKRIEDPIGLLPAKLILGINKRGVHFFRPVPKVPLECTHRIHEHVLCRVPPPWLAARHTPCADASLALCILGWQRWYI